MGQVINQDNPFYRIHREHLYQQMELNQLKSFAAIVREGSFTRAANKLFLTQPSLSHQIKMLETELGEQLLERRGRRVELTEAGRIVLAQAEQIFRCVEQIGQELAALRGLHRGRIHIGASDTTCLYILANVVQTFRTRFPGIVIHLTNRTSNEIVTLLKEGLIDFGIVTLPVSDPQVIVSPLMSLEDVAICRRGHPLATQYPVSLADLARYPLLLLEEGSTSRALLDQHFAAAEIAPDVIELGSIEVIKRYVEIDLGVSIVPKIAVTEELEEGLLQAFALPWLPPRGVGLVQRRNGYISAAEQMFLNLLQDRVQALLGDIA
jgi:DNA-binding transcriptional LysR family regulator